MSSAVFAMTLISSSGAMASRTPVMNREPPKPPARMVMRTRSW
jgi:hypothetical protein